MAHDSNPEYLLALAGCFLVLCPVFAGLRFYVRLSPHTGSRLGLDDWLVVPATVLNIGSAITIIVGVRLGVLGYATPHLGPGFQNFRTIEQIQMSFFLMSIPCLGFIKLSFVSFFRRIFIVHSGISVFNVVSAVSGVIVCLWMISFFFWTLFVCGSDVGARWTSHMAFAKECVSYHQNTEALSISDFLLDILVLLPVPMVLQLQMKTRRKIAILAVFALGLLALAASTVRMAYFITLIHEATAVDNNLLVAQALYWSMLESGIGLIACCLPTLNTISSIPVFHNFGRSVRSLFGSQKHLFQQAL